jgi:hypothetical protein
MSTENWPADDHVGKSPPVIPVQFLQSSRCGSCLTTRTDVYAGRNASIDTSVPCSHSITM